MIVSTFVNQYSKRLAGDGYARTQFTSELIQEFVEQIEIIPHAKYPQLHRARLKVEAFIKVEILKNMTYEIIIRSPFMQVVQFRGKDIVKSIFKALIDDKTGSLMPSDFKTLYACGDKEFRYRTVCDFIAGMTDRYAMEFFNRLYGTNQLTVYKPL